MVVGRDVRRPLDPVGELQKGDDVARASLIDG